MGLLVPLAGGGRPRLRPAPRISSRSPGGVEALLEEDLGGGDTLSFLRSHPFSKHNLTFPAVPVHQHTPCSCLGLCADAAKLCGPHERLCTPSLATLDMTKALLPGRRWRGSGLPHFSQLHVFFFCFFFPIRVLFSLFFCFFFLVTLLLAVAPEAAAGRSCEVEAPSVLSTHTCSCFSFQLVFTVVSIIIINIFFVFFLIVDVCLFLYRQACRY